MTASAKRKLAWQTVKKTAISLYRRFFVSVAEKLSARAERAYWVAHGFDASES